MSCKYSNIFGKPNEGFHKERLFGLAKNDLIATIILVIIIAIIFNVSLLKTALFAFIIAEVSHWLFCVNTPIINNIVGVKFE